MMTIPSTIGSTPQPDIRIAFFDHHAHTWDHDTGNQSNIIHRLNHMKETLGIHAGLRILEIGCGTGSITKWLAQCAGPNHVLAVDFSSTMLEKAKAKGIPARFLQLDICQQPPPEGEFDIALCFQVFPHFRDQAIALKNIASSLRFQGRLVVLHFVGSEQINAFHKKVGGAVGTDLLPSHEAWPSLLMNAGLEMQSLEDREDLFFLSAIRL